MSSAVVSTSAAHGRPFLFDADSGPEVYCHPERSGQCAKRIARAVEGSRLPYNRSLPGVVPASHLEVRPIPELASSGVAEIDALTGGLPRGCLTEICGPASSGRTTVLLSALAAATQRSEYCALIDGSDALDPNSLAAAKVDLDRLLWVRCGEDSPRRHRDTERTNSQKGGISPETQLDFVGNKSRCSEHRLEQVLRATDLLLESGGFGLIILDLADVPPQSARRIPLTTWFRFRRAVEHKPTILLSIEHQPIAGSCSSLLLYLGAAKRRQNAAHGVSRGGSISNDLAPEERKKEILSDSESLAPTHAHVLSGLQITVDVLRSRVDRKPSQSITFATKTAWVG
jgi:hypothetical protein